MSRLTREERRHREAIVADDAQFETLLEAALRVPVPEKTPAKRQGSGHWPALVAVAATMVLAAGAWFGLRTVDPVHAVSPLSAEIIAHINHEPAALAVSARTVPEAEFGAVLQRGGASLGAPIGRVSYAKLCPFRGRMVAHFVVQGEQGPVTVMLLPDEESSGPTTIDENGFKGTIVPLDGGGSMAVVGQPDEDLEVIRDRLLQAVRWKL